MSSQRYLYRIADHVVGICFSPSESNSIALLPSFAPFRIGEAEEEPLLMLYVEETLEPSKERSLVRTFDTGNGDTVVYQLPDGGYEYIIRDVRNRDCCLLITNADFSECHCALRGDRTMRTFGLNDAMMLVYAFAGSRWQTLLVHASCIAYQGLGFPFIAQSGTGKSTHSSLWMKHIEGAELMNDDNPVIRIIEGTPYLYGSPWSGKTPCYRNMRRPLGAVVQIDRAQANSIERLKSVQALAALLPACSSMKWDTTIYNNLCDALTTIISKTPIYTLHCLPDKASAQLCQTTIAP